MRSQAVDGRSGHLNSIDVLKVMGESGVSLTDQVYPTVSEANGAAWHPRSPQSDWDSESGIPKGTTTSAAGSAAAPELENEAVFSASVAFKRGVAYRFFKRTIDIGGALFGLVVLMPVIIVISILIALDSGGPIFHRRRVLGSHSYTEETPPRTFDAFKFRTMVPNADAVLQNDAALFREYAKEFKLRNDPRVTRIGGYLRRTSLDEIPQLVNVLRGQMTLVGPRMISPPELSMYGQNAALLLTVKPGLTGFWQVNGRQNVSYSERVRLDLWYIENRSLLLDLQILGRTIITVLTRQGAF